MDKLRNEHASESLKNLQRHRHTLTRLVCFQFSFDVSG